MMNMLYPLLAVTVISLSGFLAILLFPCMLTSSAGRSNEQKSMSQSRMLRFLIALCIGTLLGDAIIHLIPDIFSSEYVLGNAPTTVPPADIQRALSQCIFSCASKTPNFSTYDSQEEVDSCHSKCWERTDVKLPSADSNGGLEMALAILFGLYFFYSVEQLIKHRHGHDHGCDETSGENIDDNNEEGYSDIDDEALTTTASASAIGEADERGPSEGTSLLSHYHQSSAFQRWRNTIFKRPSFSINRNQRKSVKIRSFGWVVLMGEALHNIVDGLAIGAAFASSFQIGLGTAISILFHEIPHELGDFAIYVNAGFTPVRALLVNCFVNLTSFVGVIVSCLIVNSGDGEKAGDERSRLWVLAFTTGNFLYIALVDLIPELTRHKKHDEGATKTTTKHGRFSFLWKISVLPFLEHFGMFCGVGCMILIKLFGETEGGE